ncbi:MAG: glycosyltransferase [Lachnoclostridium sp.]|nr:glycosyltransferase [Lachnoclostridium sp.]
MNKYKICVYAICKNEEKFVDRWMDSMTEADKVIVLDTGSTDNTVKELRKRGAKVNIKKFDPWRFDDARNKSLSYVPDDMDICVCTDLDEVFRPGWRKRLEDAWIPGTTQANYSYNWSLNSDGSPNVQFVYFKVHVKECYDWMCPVHEHLGFKATDKYPQEKKIFVDGMILDHFPDDSKSRSSYLPLLEKAVEERPDDDRMMYYLGREYMYVGRWNDCIKTMERHLDLPTARWKEERCAAMRWMAKGYEQLGDNNKAYEVYYKAIAEVPGMRDAYIECAKMAYNLGDWEIVLFMTNEALKIKEKSGVYVNMGYSWDYNPDDLAAIANYRLGNYEESLIHAERALEYAKEDERLINNVKLIKLQCNS